MYDYNSDVHRVFRKCLKKKKYILSVGYIGQNIKKFYERITENALFSICRSVSVF